MTNSEETYSYDTLNYKSDQIRLLRVQNTEDEIIEGELANYDPDNRPLYTALSYTWEPSNPQREILVNGKPFIIGNNRWQFLASMRNTDEAGCYFWIDQICIDQANNPEKSHQVGIMAAIYNKAHEVIIWLGPEGDESDLAMDFLRSLPPIPTRSDGSRDWVTYEDKCEQLGIKLDPDARTLRGLKELFRRRYWSRLWVLQEIMFARRIRVKCGDRVLLWESIQAYEDWNFDFLHYKSLKSEDVMNESLEELWQIMPFNVWSIIYTKEEWGLSSSWQLREQGLYDVLWQYLHETIDIRCGMYSTKFTDCWGS